ITVEVKRLIDGMLMSGKSGVMPVQPVINIVKAARDFHWVHGVMQISPLDALHVATAMHMKCDYFVTTDQKLKDMLKDIAGKIGIRFTTADSIKNLLPTEAGQFELVLPKAKPPASGDAAPA
ncbi:MAG: PIN domain-containing protein, partial [Polaromonas sp.]